MPNTREWLADGGLTCACHITDNPICTPARASIYTGKTQRHHRQSQSSLDSYYQYAVQGRTDGGILRGPHERDTGNVEQSGSIWNALRANGIRTFLAGKYTHGYGSCRSVMGIDYGAKDAAGTPLGPSDFPYAVKRTPPDMECLHLRVGPGNAQPGSTANWVGGDNQPWESWFSEKLETTVVPLNTEGSITGPTFHRYDHSITSGSHSGSICTITTIDNHEMNDGDYVIIRNCLPVEYNTGHNEVPITRISDTQFSYTAVGAAPSSNVTTNGKAYVQKHYGTTYVFNKMFEYFERRDSTEKIFAVAAVNACHYSTGGPQPNMKFDGLIDPNLFYEYNGILDPVNGSIDLSVVNSNDPLLNSAAKDSWRQRWETLIHLDEQMLILKTYLTFKGWLNDTVVIFTSDQGCHYGEHAIWRDASPAYFAKQTALQPSINPPFLVNNIPGVTPGTLFSDRWTAHIDILPTVLDLFDLSTHPYKTSREGVSIIDILNDNAYPDRAFYIQHQVPGNNVVDAIFDENLVKFLTAVPGANQIDMQVNQIYDYPNDPSEATNLLVTNPGVWGSYTSGPLNQLPSVRAAALKDAVGEAYRTG